MILIAGDYPLFHIFIVALNLSRVVSQKSTGIGQDLEIVNSTNQIITLLKYLRCKPC
jgi:hypothetical protein